MRFSSIISVLLSTAALVLSFLCLFAGWKKSFMQDVDMLTLNASRIGHTEQFNTTDGDGGFLSGLVNDFEGDLNNLINDAASDIAHAFNLSDFYSVHVMDYCQGEFEPNTTAKHAHRNVTRCSNPRALFHFDPTKTIQDELPDGVTLDDLHWPDEIHDATTAVRVVSRALFVILVIGIAFTAIATVVGILSIFANGRLFGLVHFGFYFLAFLSLGVAAGLATAAIVKAVDAINKYGKPIGISGTKGHAFLGMIWGATAALFLASILSVMQVCFGHRRSRKSYGEKTY